MTLAPAQPRPESEADGPAPAHRRADIQGLRAVAVGMVVAFHAGLPLSGGFTGVDVFFVISGFVITGMLLRQQSRGGIHLASFYARRFRRLIPALALVVVVTVVISSALLLPDGAQQNAALTGAGAMLLLANAVIARTTGGYFGDSAAANPLLNTWSLSVEEQFYLVYPAVLIGGFWIARRLGRSWAPVAFVGVGTALSMGLALAPHLVPAPLDRLDGFYSPFSRAWEFGVGALLAMAAPWVARHGGRWRTWAGLAGLGALAAASVLLHESPTFPSLSALIPVGGAALILAAGIGGTSVVGRALGWTPVVRVGDWSYSIYLWHWPVIVLAAAVWPRSSKVLVLAAALSVLPAVMSYRWVEQPLRMARWASKRRDFAGQAALIVLIPLVASGAVWLSAERSTAMVTGLTNADAIRAAALSVTIGRKNGCLLIERDFTPADIDRCTFPSEGASKGWVLLTGDSHTDALSDAVIDASHRFGLDVVSLSGAGCLFSRTSAPTEAVSNCDEMASALLDRAAQDPPALAIMTQRSNADLLDPTIEELEGLGVPIVYFRDNPPFGRSDQSPIPPVCTVSFVGLDCDIPRDEAEANTRGQREAEARMLARHPEIRVIDPWAVLCTDTTCSALRNGSIVYQDYNHLNAVGSRLFTEYFAAEVDRVTRGA